MMKVKHWVMLIGALILAAVGYVVFDGLAGLLLGGMAALFGYEDSEKEIEEARARARESGERQRFHDQQAQEYGNEAEGHIDEARKDTNYDHKTGSDLEDRLRDL